MPGDGSYIGGIDANGTALDVAVPSKARCGTLDELDITKEGAVDGVIELMVKHGKPLCRWEPERSEDNTSSYQNFQELCQCEP